MAMLRPGRFRRSLPGLFTMILLSPKTYQQAKRIALENGGERKVHEQGFEYCVYGVWTFAADPFLPVDAEPHPTPFDPESNRHADTKGRTTSQRSQD